MRQTCASPFAWWLLPIWFFVVKGTWNLWSSVTGANDHERERQFRVPVKKGEKMGKKRKKSYILPLFKRWITYVLSSKISKK